MKQGNGQALMNLPVEDQVCQSLCISGYEGDLTWCVECKELLWRSLSDLLVARNSGKFWHVNRELGNAITSYHMSHAHLPLTQALTHPDT